MTGLFKSLADRVRQQVALRSLQKGERLRLGGQRERALTAYRQAIALAPGDFAAHFNLAETLSDLEQWPAAADAYEMARQINPDSVATIRGLARSLYRGEDYDRILACDFSHIDPGVEFFEMYDAIGDRCYRINRNRDAITAYAKARQILPQSWQVHQKLARAQLRTGDYREAEPNFLKVIELQPGYSWAYDGLGDCYRLQHRWSEAAEALGRACDLDPEYHWHHFKLGEVRLQQGQWQQAAAAFERCHRLDPHLPGLADRRGEVARNQAQWSRLEEYCARRETRRGQGADNAPKRKPASILLIATQPPLPPSGGSIRLSEQVRYLGSRHRLVVLCFHYSEYEIEIEEFLGRHCEFVFMAKPGGRREHQDEACPARVRDMTTCTAWNALQRLSALDFDLVLFDFIYAAEYLELFRDRYCVLQEHNIESSVLRQMADRMRESGQSPLPDTLGYDEDTLRSESEKLYAYETLTWPRFDLLTTTSEVDREQVNRRCGVKTRVVENGVDMRTALPVEQDPSGPLLFVGHLSYAPNIDAMNFFAESILPLLAAEDPGIRLVIAGRKPHQSILDLAIDPRIEVIADPAEVRAVANGCCLSVVPLRMGSGTRLKILESLSLSLPVVSTSLGCEGLELADGEHLLVRDTPAEFADAIMRLRSDASLCMKLRVNGRRAVKHRYDWDRIFAAFERDLVARLDAGEV